MGGRRLRRRWASRCRYSPFRVPGLLHRRAARRCERTPGPAPIAATASTSTATTTNPAEFTAHIIDAVLYGNSIHEDTAEHARLNRELWAAALARFTPVPSAPPAG